MFVAFVDMDAPYGMISVNGGCSLVLLCVLLDLWNELYTWIEHIQRGEWVFYRIGYYMLKEEGALAFHEIWNG